MNKEIYIQQMKDQAKGDFQNAIGRMRMLEAINTGLSNEELLQVWFETVSNLKDMATTLNKNDKCSWYHKLYLSVIPSIDLYE